MVADLPAIVWEADPATLRVTYVSDQAAAVLGYPVDAWLGDPDFRADRLHPEDHDAVVEGMRACVDTLQVAQLEYRLRAASGTWVWFQDTLRVVDDANGRRLVGVMIDVTAARSRADHEAAAAVAAVTQIERAAWAESQMREVLDNLADGVYYVDRSRLITYWNRGAEQLTGYRATEVVGRRCFDNILAHVDAKGTELCHVGCPLSATIEDGEPRQAEVWLRHAAGSRRAVHVRTAPVRDGTGEIVGAVEVFSDATGLIEAQDAAEAARRDAFTDPLTGLPNRRLLDAVLASRKDDLDRHRLPFGLLIADIDHFKWFNDTHGHDVGDRALKVIATTLQGAVRGGDAVTRWGGEEFAIVTAQVDGAGLARVAERILALIRAARVPVPAGHAPIRASIGAALAVPGEPLEGLFKRADNALMAAKTGGRDRAVLSTPGERAGGARLLGVTRGPR